MQAEAWSAGFAYKMTNGPALELAAFAPSTTNVGLSSLSKSSSIPMPWRNWSPGGAPSKSGLRVRPAASSEAQLPLPGVLDDLAGLAELTVPLASLRVVTSAAEGSLTLLNMVPAASELEKRGSRTRLGLVLWEKNSGDVTAGCFCGRGGVLNSLRSILDGGGGPARGFFAGGRAKRSLLGATSLRTRFPCVLVLFLCSCCGAGGEETEPGPADGRRREEGWSVYKCRD